MKVNNLITENQSGFQPGDSCTNQLLSLVHEIHESFDCGLAVRSVYLDMSKAFDKVWHEGLIFKLKQNGIEGKLLNLFSDYLANRKQRVVLNGMESNWGEIKAGVPQGSVLGPLLFLIYINDLEEGIESHVKFFADDTSLFSIVNDPVSSAVNLQHDLNLITEWAYQWKMSFNPDPTKPAEEVLFSQKVNSPDHPPIYFNNIEVKRVYDHKHLGLNLDPKLSFIKHISEKIGIARKGIGIIKNLSPYLSLKKAHKKTSNLAVLLETGRHTLAVSAQLQAVKYFLRFPTIKQGSLLRKYYEMEKLYSSNNDKFIPFITSTLNSIGMSNIWREQLAQNRDLSKDTKLIKTIKLRLKDISSQTMISTLKTTPGKLHFLAKLKNTHIF